MQGRYFTGNNRWLQAPISLGEKRCSGILKNGCFGLICLFLFGYVEELCVSKKGEPTVSGPELSEAQM